MNSQYIIIILAAILSTITLTIILFRDYISQKLRLIDRPDQDRKIHKKPMPLVGGCHGGPLERESPQILSHIALDGSVSKKRKKGDQLKNVPPWTV